jgi:hypothetical protein
VASEEKRSGCCIIQTKLVVVQIKAHTTEHKVRKNDTAFLPGHQLVETLLFLSVFL